MIQKYSSIAMIAGLFLLCNPVLAQQEVNEFELVKTVLHMEKRNYIRQYIDLNEEDQEIFWTIYDDFDSKHGKILRERINLLQEYTSKYPDISNSDAERIVKENLDLEKDEAKLKKKCFRLMKRKINAKTAAQFIRIEEYIQGEIKNYLLRDLPFINN